MVPDTASPSPTVESPRRNQWQLPAFAAGLAAAVCAWAYFPPQAFDSATSHQRLLVAVRKHLDQKPPDLIALDDAVKRLAPLVDHHPEDAHRARFLLGSARVVAAEHGSQAAKNLFASLQFSAA